jgi:2-isopropylmalate synthase
MLKHPASKYRAFAPVALNDRTWPDAVLTRPPSGAASTFATATRL